jgi:hypothetical protein
MDYLKGLIECGGKIEGPFCDSKWFAYWAQFKDLIHPGRTLLASGPNMSSREVPPHFHVKLGRLILECWELTKPKGGEKWPRQAEVARRLGITRMAVHRLVEYGELRSNEKGRIDPESLLEYIHNKGVAYNEQ